MIETITLKNHITSNKFGVVYPANVKLSFFYEKSLKRYYAQHPSKKSLYIAVDNDNIVEYVDVVFRKFKFRTKEVIALMPYLSGGGKYSEADYDYVMSVSRPATEEEYADLKTELEDIGYLVNPIKRANHKKCIMENNEWVCTDPSNNQYRKNLPDGTFLFKEDRQNSPLAGDTYTFECTINIDDYLKEEIESALSAFGYKYEEIDNDRELIAECLFEMED